MNTDYQKLAEQIFLAGVQSVLPGNMIRDAVKLSGQQLRIGERQYSLPEIENVYVLGAGKASGLMALELERILGPRIADGLVIVKYGHGCPTGKIRIAEAAHPVPDSNGFKAAGQLLALARKATQKDLVICLISGGGSALLADFPEGSTPEEIQQLSTMLLQSGASIQEMNCLRKHLSRVKGGQLAKAIFPAQLTCLILSDVVGDLLDVIASGPTVSDPSSFADALDILSKYHLAEAIPPRLLEILNAGKAQQIPETPKPGDVLFAHTQNLIIGSNRMALEAARRKGTELGFHSIIVDAELEGSTVDVTRVIVETCCSRLREIAAERPICFLFGGETTLRVTGGGLGGRNQHMALLASLLLKDKDGFTFLAAGSDGTDGPTDAAGAVVDGWSVQQALARNLDPVAALRSFDSYNFFRQAGGHITTGPTKTNVMDIIVVLASPTSPAARAAEMEFPVSSRI